MTSHAVPSAPRFEHFAVDDLTLGLGTGAPRISWTVTGAAGFAQRGYELEVTTVSATTVYAVEGTAQVLVQWPAAPLRSRERASVRVRVSDGTQWSEWGAPAIAEVGLLEPTDWSAAFISPVGIAGLDEPAPIVEGAIDIPGEIVRARLYATAHGIFTASINGMRVDDTVLSPGWTAYDERLRYRTFDVTALVHSGTNTVQALLGNGWYRGYLSYLGERALYGDRLAFCAQLEVDTADGARHVLGTDGSWTAHESAVTEDDLYNGQSTDLRRDAALFARVPVELVPTGTRALVAPDGAPMRPTGTHAAVRIWASPTGRTLVDFGQNAVGWVRLAVRGLADGTTVAVRHAEVIEDGELGTRPLRSARATDSYVLDGRDEAVLEPDLTLHGFRYAEVTGIDDLQAADIEQVVIGTDLERTGWFECSDPMINRLHENVVWSTRGNFVDLPTDCPQRNERLGWTGDIQVFGPTALFLYDVSGLLTSWLADLAAEQYPSGGVPHVVPNTNRSDNDDPEAAAWGDAATIVPWTLYQRMGDQGILERQLRSMKAWVDRVAELAGPDLLWTSGFQFGDWLDPTSPPDRPQDAKAAAEVVATAHFARSAAIVAQAAAVVGDDAAARQYADLAARVRAAFAASYVSPAGRIVSEAQTCYALAIEWDLLPTTAQRAEAGRRLAELVRRSGFRIATGFVGTPLICDALTHAGYADLAGSLLFQTECPSWLYPVSMGATTVWERWDSMLPDGTVNPGEMTSFNHYALGAVADWLHRTVAGLEPTAPGYRRIRIAPIPLEQLDWASARHLSPYGEIAVRWERIGDQVKVDTWLPAGVVADVLLPGTAPVTAVGEGEHSWTVTMPRAAKDLTVATIRDLMDHRATWTAVVDAMQVAGLVPHGELQAIELLRVYMDEPALAITSVINNHIDGKRGRFPREHPVHAQVEALLRATSATDAMAS